MSTEESPSVAALWSTLTAAQTEEELRGALAAAGLSRFGDSVIGNHVLLSNFESRLTATLDNLTQVAPLGLSLAPVIGPRHTAGNHVVQLLTFSACDGDVLVPALEHPGPFGPEIRQRFRDDLHRLFATGKDHPVARRSRSQWWCGRRSQILVLTAWGALPPFSHPDDVTDAIEAIDKELRRLP